MLELRYSVVDNASGRLAKLARQLNRESREQANRVLALTLYRKTMEIFTNQGADSASGRPAWQDLKKGGRWKYVMGKDGNRKRLKSGALKKRWQGAYKILQDTGALRASFVPLHDPAIAGVGALSSSKHADLAPIHEKGNPARGLPARPMLPGKGWALKQAVEVYGQLLEKAAEK